MWICPYIDVETDVEIELVGADAVTEAKLGSRPIGTSQINEE